METPLLCYTVCMEKTELTAHSLLTRDGRRLVSRRGADGTERLELVPEAALPPGTPPARKWTIYVLKATHTDIGLHNPPYVQRHGTVRRIEEAARLIDADTRADDDPAAYRYVMEGAWFWENYPMDRGEAAARRIVADYVARCRMDVGVTCAGNHEFSQYVGEAEEDEAYKAQSFAAVQGVYPNDLVFASRIVHGVNFVAVDNTYYRFTGTVSLYYYERGKRLLKRRTASAKAVFSNPELWPGPEVVARGDENRPTDAGNPNAATLSDGRHAVAWYSGAKRPDATVYLTILPPHLDTVPGKECLE